VLAATGLEAQTYQSVLEMAFNEATYDEFILQPEAQALEEDILQVIRVIKSARKDTGKSQVYTSFTISHVLAKSFTIQSRCPPFGNSRHPSARNSPSGQYRYSRSQLPRGIITSRHPSAASPGIPHNKAETEDNPDKGTMNNKTYRIHYEFQ
jgi:hypothetical protein